MAKEPDMVIVPVPYERTRTEYVDRHVTINRAPTDESVKLLREMEQKAEAEVIKAVQVGNATFECVVHQWLDPMSDKINWRAIFKLNGKQMTAEVTTETRRSGYKMDAVREDFDKLSQEVAKVIAREVLHAAFVANMHARFNG